LALVDLTFYSNVLFTVSVGGLFKIIEKQAHTGENSIQRDMYNDSPLTHTHTQRRSRTACVPGRRRALPVRAGEVLLMQTIDSAAGRNADGCCTEMYFAPNNNNMN